jgi:hypothetical protein
MALLPIRNLGDVGVTTDAPGHDLPINAFTFAKNVRFDEGKVSRSPIFRNVKSLSGLVTRHAYGIQPSTGFDRILVLLQDFRAYEYANGSTTYVTNNISGTTIDEAFTCTTLADVTYVCRSDHVPISRSNSSTGNFANLANWDSTWRAKSLRSYGDQLIALNLVEGSTEYPNRVRFSNITTANSEPDSWDAADTTKSAGFNDLVQMKTPIVDGMTLGNAFIIYSEDQVWSMQFVGGQFIFNFRKLFQDIGMINKNCAVEVEGKHFVFGLDDIYTHDGNSYQSIADNRVKNFVFKGLNATRRDRCYVQHNPLLNEIYFCYNSDDAHVAYANSPFCNRAAVFNYRNGTWSFMDLPNTVPGTTANLDAVTTYATAASTLTYNAVGGSYNDQADSFGKTVIMLGKYNADDGLTSDRMYALDLSDEGSVSFPYLDEANQQPFLERQALDLDEAGLPLSGYKVISRLYPQLNTTNADKQVTFTFGATDLISQAPAYGSDITFNMETDYKIDTRNAGRYVSYKMTYTDEKDFQLTGFDMDVTVTGRR